MDRNRTHLSSRGKLVLLGVLATLAACALVLGLSTIGVMAAAGGGNASGCREAAGVPMPGVPARLVPIYHRAAAKHVLGPDGPAILAAVNFTETNWGANLGPSSAGAIGWMQFLPSTWRAYGVDANGDGRRDPDDPEDAIFAAARLLRASGAPGDWRGALWSYNHSDAYVAKVLGHAAEFGGGGGPAAAPAECLSPTAGGPALQRMLEEAERIDRLALDYVWGGSHGITPTPADGPFDCSSAVSHLLQVAGYENETMTTAGLIHWGEPGPGAQVTIRVKAYGPDAHTFLEFSPQVTGPERRYWGTSTTNPGGGPGWIPQGALSASYLSGFEQRHPPGL